MNETYSSSISQKYLLVLFSPMVMRNQANQLCVSKAWAKDLIEHKKYINDITFLSYESVNVPPADALLISDPCFSGINFQLLPQPSSFWDALLRLPSTLKVLYREIEQSRIIHSAVAGWPIPEAWHIAPILVFKRRFHLLIVESAFWRIPPGNGYSFRARLRSYVFEQLNRFCVESANLTIFTHDRYRLSLLKKNWHRGHVIPASWINSSDVIGTEELRALTNRKLARQNEPLRLLYVGRLSEQKGVLLLIDAITNLSKVNCNVRLDIYGEGPLLELIAKKVRDANLAGIVRILGVLTYGATFFEAIREQDLMVIPSLSDEQPRNVYDAFSQGLAVLCSDTPGLTSNVENGQTGFYFQLGSLQDLERAILEAIANRGSLTTMAEHCVAKAKTLTHFLMHQRRLSLLEMALKSTLRRSM
jgi:glycosyltransferase involved in cell wall biosynthesis